MTDAEADPGKGKLRDYEYLDHPGYKKANEKYLERLDKPELWPNHYTETDPAGKTPHEKGSKLDSGKAAAFRGLIDYFPRACLAVAEVSTKGAEKYTWKGWESVPDGIGRYSDALVRHLTALSIEGEQDKEGFLHRAQVAWNALAVLELYLRGNEKENPCK